MAVIPTGTSNPLRRPAPIVITFSQGQFSETCDVCHDTTGWSPVARFEHNIQSQFPLVGAHNDVSCDKCHVNNQYVPNPTECADCHMDVHDGKLGASCEQCHSVTDWAVNTAQDHDFGQFSLEGHHDRLPCESCHGVDREDTLAGRGPECVNCHRDPHFGSFGPECHECHTQNAFLPSTFLHYETGFRLSGAHRFVDCKDCHPGRVYGGLPNDCFFCHQEDFEATQGSEVCDHPTCIPGGLPTCHNCHRTTSWIPARGGASCGECSQGVGP